jgi:pimeloyl-ACP methyl ester carboxylesterase
MRVNGLDLHVEDSGGDGEAVVLLHGWPDSGRLWRNQVPALVAAGYRVIVPDLRGFGRSSRPDDVAAYRLPESAADIVGILDDLAVRRCHLVGHDWGAALAWVVAAVHGDRLHSLTALSVPHPAAPRTLKQREMAWYQLFFQFPRVAEEWLVHDDWSLLRQLLRDDGDIEHYICDLSRPGALTASLNWYRANLAPRPPSADSLRLPQITVPTMGIWSDGDHYLDGDRMVASEQFVDAPWRYEQISGAGHWIPLDAADRLTTLLLDWLAAREPGRPDDVGS